ncbi:LA2681 family HEPN domain-containing protein [Vibrio metschnikovii]|uniref:LA2681 family HEPN domain-containing protein n=1 Tax=Vibrio metschnikovii TaxID=28172 RepID=UPI001C2F6D68|nr:LA2681 family HEPN domain-containing protein [Vibrio metschnikovii]
MEEKQTVLIDSDAISLFSERVDELSDTQNVADMEEFIGTFDAFTPVFEDDFREAQFHYMLGNAYSLLYVPQLNEWYNPNLNKVIIHFKKALNALKNSNTDDEYQIDLISQIETNYGNYLSQQGRFMCAKRHWKNAINLNNQPIAHTAMYQNELYLSRCISYDEPKAIYHQFLAYKSLCERLRFPNNQAYFNDSHYIFDDERTQDFKQWFEEQYTLDHFKQFYKKHDKELSKKEVNYLHWCGKNNLFIDELEIDELPDAIYPDSLSLPSISSRLNITLAYHEEFVYHANFDEIKSDFCYARYLIFSASNIPNDKVHFFNNTFKKTEDLTHTIDNIKAQQLKSAFKILYSLFDKIAYFISHYYDLNDIEKDQQISFENLFKKPNSGKRNKEWKPHDKLKDSKNQFLHALFYILKDLRDIKDQESISEWLNPDLVKICEIRNYIEHRSFKLIDSLYSDLVFSDAVQKNEIRHLIDKIKKYRCELIALYPEIKKQKGTDKHIELIGKQELLEKKIKHIENQLYEKKKRSKHTLIMIDEDFNTQLMTLAELVRNSIIYLSFSIELDEQTKPQNDEKLVWHREVPTK